MTHTTTTPIRRAVVSGRRIGGRLHMTWGTYARHTLRDGEIVSEGDIEVVRCRTEKIKRVPHATRGASPTTDTIVFPTIEPTTARIILGLSFR